MQIIASFELIRNAICPLVSAPVLSRSAFTTDMRFGFISPAGSNGTDSIATGVLSIESATTKVTFPKFKVEQPKPISEEEIENKLAEEPDNDPATQLSDIPHCPVCISKRYLQSFKLTL